MKNTGVLLKTYSRRIYEHFVRIYALTMKTYPIQVTFLSPDLDSEPSRITGGIGTTAFTTYGREPNGSASFVTDF
jgi:hypothetical protein